MLQHREKKYINLMESHSQYNLRENKVTIQSMAPNGEEQSPPLAGPPDTDGIGRGPHAPSSCAVPNTLRTHGARAHWPRQHDVSLCDVDGVSPLPCAARREQSEL